MAFAFSREDQELRRHLDRLCTACNEKKLLPNPPLLHTERCSEPVRHGSRAECYAGGQLKETRCAGRVRVVGNDQCGGAP